MLATAVTGALLGWWWAALAAGLVVALVVIVLLHRLLTRVHEIEDGARLVWSTGKAVARNTATTWMFDDTADALEDLRDEALRHGELLRGEGS